MIKLYFSYGLQPGSCLILFLFLCVTHHLMTLCIDYTELAVGKTAEQLAYESNGVQVAMMLFVLFQIILSVTCLGYGVIIRGKRQMLVIWTAFEGLFFIIWEAELIWYLIEYTRIGFRGVGYAMLFILLYYIVYTAFYYWYEINLSVRCLPSLSTTSTISDLEPIGKGLNFILDYYKTHGKSAASLVLMSEIMLSVHVFLERHIVEYGLGFDYMDDEIDRSTALYLEETVIRYLRVGVCIIGYYLTYKERKLWMFNWCLVYLFTVTLSVGVFAYLIFAWRAVHSLLTLVYFSTFVLNLLYRVCVLYVCMRYSDVYERQTGIPL